MNLFFIISSLIFFQQNSIYGFEFDGLNTIDVLGSLKDHVRNCHLQSFVRSNDDYKQLNEDLTNYCTTSPTSRQYLLICNMLFYGIKKACKLSYNQRGSLVMYTSTVKSQEICSDSDILSINEWILSKITDNGNIKVDVNAKDLCAKVTNDPDTINLANFFYKIAPYVRQNEPDKSGNTNQKWVKESAAETLQKAKELVEAAKNKVVDTVKDAAEQVIDARKNRFGYDLNVGKGVKQVIEAEKNEAVDASKGLGEHASENQLDGTRLRKPIDEDTRAVYQKEERKLIENKPIRTQQTFKTRPQLYDDAGVNEWSGGFGTYVFLFTLFVVIGYLILHNKNKLLDCISRSRRSGIIDTVGRSSFHGYENLIDVNDFIQNEDTTIVTDKDFVLLKA